MTLSDFNYFRYQDGKLGGKNILNFIFLINHSSKVHHIIQFLISASVIHFGRSWALYYFWVGLSRNCRFVQMRVLTHLIVSYGFWRIFPKVPFKQITLTPPWLIQGYLRMILSKKPTLSLHRYSLVTLCSISFYFWMLLRKCSW